MTPEGREKEAAIGQMLASHLRVDAPDGQSKASIQDEMELVDLVKRTWPTGFRGLDSPAQARRGRDVWHAEPLGCFGGDGEALESASLSE